MLKRSVLKSRLFVAAAAVFCTLLWGSAFPCIKLGYRFFGISGSDYFPVILFAGARFFFAGVLVLTIGLILFPSEIGLKRKDILPVSVLGFFQTFLQYLLLYSGLIHISGTRSSILTAVSAFGSVIISAIIFKDDRLTGRKLAGCIIGLMGLLFMNISAQSEGFSMEGDGLVIISNLCAAAGNVISKKISGGRNPLQLTGWNLLLGGLALTVIGLAGGGRLTFCTEGILMLLYLGSMSGIAFMVWTMLLFHNDVSRVAVFILLIPVSGTMWSGIVLGENIITLTNLISLGLVCSGIFLVNFSYKRKGMVRADRRQKQSADGSD